MASDWLRSVLKVMHCDPTLIGRYSLSLDLIGWDSHLTSINWQTILSKIFWAKFWAKFWTQRMMHCYMFRWAQSVLLISFSDIERVSLYRTYLARYPDKSFAHDNSLKIFVKFFIPLKIVILTIGPSDSKLRFFCFFDGSKKRFHFWVTLWFLSGGCFRSFWVFFW